MRSKGGGGRPDMMPLLDRTRGLLRRFDLRPRKGLGQHFLVDGEVLEDIVSAAGLAPGDVIVEVGPGLGILTAELVKLAGRVVAVEYDARLASALEDVFADSPNLQVRNMSALEFDPAGLPPGYKVVANLPYYVASPIIRHFLETSHKPGRMVVMVQKEVGDSMVAAPGRMSLLGVSVQYYGRPTLVRYVSRKGFYPPPEVDSALVSIDVYPAPQVDVPDVGRFFSVVRAGFSARRKQLHNALARGFGISTYEIAELLEKTGIDHRRRAQTLSIEEWAAVSRALISCESHECNDTGIC
ncbi:16S rRNA (adenine(1518)-N(6)/adenine(1519)-N(6))-dimethyltransferase RsmA [Chloroflexota bacterium]